MSRVGVRCGARQGRTALAVSAVLAVLVAVVSDLVAAEGALHVLTLGAVTALTGVWRVALAGRDRGLLRLLTGCLLAQPVLHAVVELLPHAPLDHSDGAGFGGADLLISGTQLAVALAVVGTVTFLEQLVLTAATVVRVWAMRVGPVEPPTGAHLCSLPRTPVRAGLASRYRPIAMRKRGPPCLSAA